MLKKKGFTIVELLVVIAIIGILSSVVIANLSTARVKSRDSKRASDISSIQIGLALHLDKYGYYPSSLDSLKGTDNFIAEVPKDPSTGEDYKYVVLGDPDTNSCWKYHLAATLEDEKNMPVDDQDYNSTTGSLTFCTTGGGIDGTDGGDGTNDKTYDVSR